MNRSKERDWLLRDYAIGKKTLMEMLDSLGLSTFRTFVVDPPTMFLFGLAAAWATGKWVKKNPTQVLFILCVVFQLCFWILGPLMYFDYSYFAKQGLGNDFMWNGYLGGLRVVPEEWIPTYKNPSLNFIAMIGWLIQPFCIWWGVVLGNRLLKKKVKRVK